jgi:hypothetical protein
MRSSVSASVAAVRAAASIAALLLAVTAIALGRSGNLDPFLIAGAINPSIAALSAEELTDQAAHQLELATAKGGQGYRFEVVQTTTMTAKPGGPLIDIPDPTNGRAIIGQATEYPYYVLLEQGLVTPAGFWSELRSWPIGAGEPDFNKAELRRSALVRDDDNWRNDREGWYRAEVLPGVGLDPQTADLLPKLLRQSTEQTKKDPETLDGAVVLRVDVTGKVANIPGVVAADGASYTELIAPVKFSFDESGRLVQIRVVALNANLKTYDLVVDTVISISYDGIGSLPAPVPAWKPGPSEDTGR